MVQLLRVRTHNAGLVSSKRAKIKTPLVMKATERHLMKSTSLEKTQSPVYFFCYAQNRVCDAVLFTFCNEMEFGYCFDTSAIIE